MRRRAAFLVLVAAILALAPASVLAAGWLTPASPPPGPVEIDSDDMGLDAQGNAVAVWTAYHVAGRRTEAAVRPVGGAWSTPVTFSVPDERSGWNPRVAVGAGGDAVAVWSSTRYSAVRQITMAAVREAGGDWSDPVALSDTEHIGISYQPTVAVDSEGTATVIWVEDTEYSSAIHTSSRPRGGEWSEPVELTAREERAAGRPQLAVNADGELVAVWKWHEYEYAGGLIQAATRSADGEWSAPADLSDPDLRSTDPQVALNDQGDMVAVWTTARAGVHASRRAADSGWSPAVGLSPAEGRAPHVAIDPQGTATAVWEVVDDVGRRTQASTGSHDGPWSAAVDLSTQDDANRPGSFPRVATDPQGDVTVIWRAFYDPPVYSRATVVRREAGGSWSDPFEIATTSGAIQPLRVAADPQGYVTALWSLGSQIHSSVYDAVAPELDDVTVPASGLAGAPVAMSANPFDLWPPVTTRWQLGDGATATGTTVQHCYSTPGQRTITITATDGAGNTTNTVRAIEIQADPTIPAGTDPCAEPDPDPDPRPRPDPDPEPGPEPGPRPRPDPDPEPGPKPEPEPDAGPATVSNLRQSATRWRTRRVHRRPRLPVGTTFRFHLDRQAPVRLAFTHITPGRRIKTRCLKTTKANRTRPRCTRRRSLGRLQTTGTAGTNSYRFRGKIGRRTLPPGRYRLRLTALHDGKPSSAATITFTIAR